METDLTVALVAGVVAIGSAVYTRIATSRQAEKEREFKAKTDTELEMLRHALAAAQQQEDRSLEAREIIDHYRRPLLVSAVELNRRLGNIRANNFMAFLEAPGRRADVALTSTLYRFASFLGWREMLTRKLVFLDFEDSEHTKTTLERLENVTTKLSSSGLDWIEGVGPRLMLWKDEQRAIGGLMCEPDGDGILGFESFFEQYHSRFGPWLSSFAEDLQGPGVEQSERLEQVSEALYQLIGLLDDKNVFSGRV